MLVRADCTSLLQAYGLDTFQAVYNYQGGKILKQRDRRTLIKLELDHPGRRAQLFLKKHEPVSVRQKLWSWLKLRSPISPGRHEWQNIRALEKLGIESLPVIAFGEEKKAGASFLLSLALADERTTDGFIRERFQLPLSEEDLALKRQLIGALANLARAFHGAGFNHRDFYLSHFYLRQPTPGDFRLRLIDLQRMERRCCLRGRWLVKDLAALNYSAPDVIRPADKIRFFRRYRKIDTLRPRDKRLVRSILRKTQRIRAHDLKSKERQAREHVTPAE